MRLAIPMLFAGLAACPAADSYRLVPDQSTVRFKGTSTLHDFAGTAKLVDGAVRIDGAASTGVIEADATSMETAHASRDAKMHGEIMGTVTWPRIRFELCDFVPGPTGGVARGSWTMHGVTRVIDVPVALVAGPVARLTARVTLDIRDWDIPVPRAALVISVDPTITVELDLALQPDAEAAIPPAEARGVADLVVADAAGAAVRLDAIAIGRPIVVFTDDGVSDAKEWVDSLGAKLPADHQPITILDGRDLSEKQRNKSLRNAPAKSLVDATGSLRSALKLPKRDIQVLPVTTTGRIDDPVEGEADDARRDRVLGRMSVAVP